MVERNKIIHMVDIIVNHFIPYRGATLIGDKPPRDKIANLCSVAGNVKIFAKFNRQKGSDREQTKEQENSPDYLIFVILALGGIQTDLPKRIRDMVDLAKSRHSDNTITIPPGERAHFMIISEPDLIDKHKMVRMISNFNQLNPMFTYKMYPDINFMANIPGCSAVPKFSLLKNSEVEEALKLGMLSKQELPSVTDRDPTVVWSGGVIGECIQYERFSPNVGTTTIMRRIVKTPSAVKNAGDVDAKEEVAESDEEEEFVE